MIKTPLPDKIYFSIGEVARFFGVSTSLIRYWEDEFPQITPRKNGKGDRRYNKQDIEKVAKIYELIKEKGFTIRGAQSFLAEKTDRPERKEEFSVKDKLLEIKSFLVNLKSELKNL
jgi:DNA-binding transcriptional MerR regulator